MATASDLRHRIALQRRVAGVDAAGQASETWVTVDTVWAAVVPLRGREWFAAGQEQGSADVRVTVRWRDDITTGMRVVPAAGAPCAGLPLDIQGLPIELAGQRRMIELMCLAGVKDGR